VAWQAEAYLVKVKIRFENEGEEDCPETLKLRNEPNFSAKKPMKVHKCPKKRTQFKATGEAGLAIKSGF